MTYHVVVTREGDSWLADVPAPDPRAGRTSDK